MFDSVADEAIAGYDRLIELDLSEVSVDGSRHKAPPVGKEPGKTPGVRGKLGFKWSIMVDRDGIPLGWATSGANRHDSILFDPPSTLWRIGVCSSTSKPST